MKGLGVVNWKRILASASGIGVILLGAAMAMAPQWKYGYSCVTCSPS